jgi:hypothetical protein
VAKYRIITLDDRGALTGGSDFECSCDDDARARSRMIMAAGEQAMVWAGVRYLGLVAASAGPRTEPHGGHCPAGQ